MAAREGGTKQGDRRHSIPSQREANGVRSKASSNGHRENRTSNSKPKADRSAESALDSLFVSQETYETHAPDVAPQYSALDGLRRRFITELIPAFHGLAEKYATKGVILEIDADHFINGGRNVTITIQYENAGTRLDGVVTDTAIAFAETHFSANDRGGVSASGPSLRTRDLSAHLFRDFICRQIAPLVQSVMRRRR